MAANSSEVRIREIHPRNIEELESEMKLTGVDYRGIKIMSSKADFGLWKISGVTFPALNILKQEMLSAGGDLAVHRNVVSGSIEKSDGIIIGSRAVLERVAGKLEYGAFDLKEVGRLLTSVVAGDSRSDRDFLACGRNIELKHDGGYTPAVMGILNVTPDSFYDGGKYKDIQSAVDEGLRMAEEGALIIDIGGESTRPGAASVSVTEELDRVIPVVEILAGVHGLIVSVDTRKRRVAEAALDAGAVIVNDVSAGRDDQEMLSLAAERGAGIVLMHMKGTPRTMQKEPHYTNVMDEISAFLMERAAAAVNEGIRKESIILDPGIGFGKTVEHNLTILGRVRELVSLDYPVLIGLSRKSFLGAVLGLGEPGDRLIGTIAASALVAAQGVKLLRAHDVAETIQACKVASALSGYGE